LLQFFILSSFTINEGAQIPHGELGRTAVRCQIDRLGNGQGGVGDASTGFGGVRAVGCPLRRREPVIQAAFDPLPVLQVVGEEPNLNGHIAKIEPGDALAGR